MKIIRKLKLWIRKTLSILYVFLYGAPSRKMHIIGVTGTNGKTITANLIWAILNKNGKKTGLISDVNFRMGEIEWLNTFRGKNFTHFNIRKLLRRMLKTECEYVVIEVSYNSISKTQLWAINFDTAVLTNLTHDHLIHQKDFEEYQNTKSQLLSDTVTAKRYDNTPRRIILNADSTSYDFFKNFKGDENYTYSIRNKETNIKAERIKVSGDSTYFTVKTPLGKIDIKMKLPGAFNIYNALAAISVGVSENISLKKIKLALEEFDGVPGRMEKINEGQNFSVFVDYASTPFAFEEIFKSAKELVGPNGRIISVFGATGEQNKGKRPKLGKIAAKYSKYCFLTLEDPGKEDPLEIINQIEPGLKSLDQKENIDYFKIIDRRDAIKRAFESTREGDVVLLLAKGHETNMVLKNHLIPWDERQVAREELRKYLKKNPSAKK